MLLITKRVKMLIMASSLIIMGILLHNIYSYDPLNDEKLIRIPFYDKLHDLSDYKDVRIKSSNNNNNKDYGLTGAIIDEKGNPFVGKYHGDSEVVPDFSDKSYSPPGLPAHKEDKIFSDELLNAFDELDNDLPLDQHESLGKENEPHNDQSQEPQSEPEDQKQKQQDKSGFEVKQIGHHIPDKHSIIQRSKDLTARINELQASHGGVTLKHSIDHSDPSKVIKMDEDHINKQDEDVDITKGDSSFQHFFAKFLNILSENRQSHLHPDRTHIVGGKPIIPNVRAFEASDSYLTEERILQLLNFEDEFVNDLTEKHKKVVESIPSTPPANFYKGSGYTMVGGGIYSWYAYLAIQGLRNIGSVLPIEVVLPFESDYEENLCENLLPELNAKCVLMTKVFGKETLDKFELTGYQFKSFALLASSFENTFLLDADSFAVMNPDVLFTSELYLNLEMITWPDFWKRTTSPYYYKVAGIKVGDKPVRRMNDQFTDAKYFYKESEIEKAEEKVEFHDRQGTIPDWTSESGELLIRKSTHFDALLLSLYYNFDGPQGYYPLLSQGGAGEGDKETFIAASRFYNKPYYQVNRKPDRLFGYYKDQGSGEWDHTTIAQFDPIGDFENLKKVVKNIQNQIKKAGEGNFRYDYEEMFRRPWNNNENLKPMFYHVHNPKMDPFPIKNKKITVDPNNEQIRNIGGEFNKWIDFDFELWIYEMMKKDLVVDRLQFDCFKDDHNMDEIEPFLKERIEYLKKSHFEILQKEIQWNDYHVLEDDIIGDDDARITKQIFDKLFEDVPFLSSKKEQAVEG